MGNPNLDLELSSLLKSSMNAASILYDFYEEEIKVLMLILIALGSFLLGKRTVTDPL